jgi:hypothetical protein
MQKDGNHDANDYAERVREQLPRCLENMQPSLALMIVPV